MSTVARIVWVAKRPSMFPIKNKAACHHHVCSEGEGGLCGSFRVQMRGAAFKAGCCNFFLLTCNF